MNTRNPDQLLAQLRVALEYAPSIHDLEVRLRWYRIIATRADCALALDPMTTDQRDALTALLHLAAAGSQETVTARDHAMEAR